MRTHGENRAKIPPWCGEQGVEERMRETDFVGNKQKVEKTEQQIQKVKRKK